MKSKIYALFRIFICIWIINFVFIIYSDFQCFALDNSVDVVYFYSPTCSSCAEVSEYLEKLENESENIIIHKYNIYDSKYRRYLNMYCNYYDVSSTETGLVPIIFIRNTNLFDKDDIVGELENVLLDDNAGDTVILDYNNDNYKESEMLVNSLDFLGVFSVALVNGLNPCSFSMIMFLLMLIGNKSKSILRIGISFCFGKVLAFVLIGSICYHFIKLLTNIYIITIANALFVVIFILLAGINIYDFVMIKLNKIQKIKGQLPSKFRKINHTIIRSFTEKLINSKYLLLLSVLLGMIIASTEFLCSGQLYLTTIVTIIQTSSSNSTQAILLLVLYSIVYTLPLLLVVIIISKGMKEIEVSIFFLNHLDIIKLVYAVMFLAMATLILFTIII